MTEVKDIDREAAQETDIEYTHLCKAFARHREAAEKAERDRIVAWLRECRKDYSDGGYEDSMVVNAILQCADVIERGPNFYTIDSIAIRPGAADDNRAGREGIERWPLTSPPKPSPRLRDGSGGRKMTSETCETCQYRQPDERPEFSTGGHCRRYPPTISEQVAFDGTGANHYSQLWPWMALNDWCGEYRRAR